jgi:hypothetical protein
MRCRNIRIEKGKKRDGLAPWLARQAEIRLALARSGCFPSRMVQLAVKTGDGRNCQTSPRQAIEAPSRHGSPTEVLTAQWSDGSWVHARVEITAEIVAQKTFRSRCFSDRPGLPACLLPGCLAPAPAWAATHRDLGNCHESRPGMLLFFLRLSACDDLAGLLQLVT